MEITGSMRANGKTIVLTGASSGLGKAMARAFVSEGANVSCSSRTKEKLEKSVSEISTGKGPGKAIAVQADVQSWKDVQNLFEVSSEQFGPVDVLVNNAAIRQWYATGSNLDDDKPISEVPVETWDTVLNTNLRGVFLCSKAALAEMLTNDRGRIIHITSSHGAKASPNYGPYVTSKWGLEGFHETLSLELRGTGVDSIALRPPGGGIYTERREEQRLDRKSFQYDDPGIITNAATRIVGGEGENGGRYVSTDNGDDFHEYHVNDVGSRRQ